MIRNESNPPLLLATSWMLSASSQRPTLRRYQTVRGHGIDRAAKPGKKHQVNCGAYCVRREGPSNEAHKWFAPLSTKKNIASAIPTLHIAPPMTPVGSGSGTCDSS